MACEVFVLNLDMCNTVSSVAMNDSLGVRKVILRINLMREASGKELSIRAAAIKKFIDVREMGSGDVEMNVVAADGRRKRDILRGFRRFGLVEGQRARNP